MPPILFADSNVLIEALLIPQSAAYVVAEMVARGVFDLATCQICVTDTENAIVGKLRNKPDLLDQVIENWEKLKTDIRLTVLEDPELDLVSRHKRQVPGSNATQSRHSGSGCCAFNAALATCNSFGQS
ncbi:MAG: hypothetical protein P4L53_06235 [Candidatus Obscuribacterales bacterium]|nr:hypothetical protein [Candidatus Obscuribacterales bacterium]